MGKGKACFGDVGIRLLAGHAQGAVRGEETVFWAGDGHGVRSYD